MTIKTKEDLVEFARTIIVSFVGSNNFSIHLASNVQSIMMEIRVPEGRDYARFIGKGGNNYKAFCTIVRQAALTAKLPPPTLEAVRPETTSSREG